MNATEDADITGTHHRGAPSVSDRIEVVEPDEVDVVSVSRLVDRSSANPAAEARTTWTPSSSTTGAGRSSRADRVGQL